MFLKENFADRLNGTINSFGHFCIENPAPEPAGGATVETPSGNGEPKAPVVPQPAPTPAPAPVPTPGGDPDWLPARLERAKKAAERETTNAILGGLGLTSEAELKALAEERRAAMSEADRLKLENNQLLRQKESEAAAAKAEAERLKKERDDLAHWKRKTTKTLGIDKALDELEKDTDSRTGMTVVSREQVRQLLWRDFDLAEDGKLVARVDGVVVQGRDALTHVAEYLDKNSHLIVSRAKNGAGSTPTPGGGPSMDTAPNVKTTAGRYQVWQDTMKEKGG